MLMRLCVGANFHVGVSVDVILRVGRELSLEKGNCCCFSWIHITYLKCDAVVLNVYANWYWLTSGKHLRIYFIELLS